MRADLTFFEKVISGDLKKFFSLTKEEAIAHLKTNHRHIPVKLIQEEILFDPDQGIYIFKDHFEEVFKSDFELKRKKSHFFEITNVEQNYLLTLNERDRISNLFLDNYKLDHKFLRNAQIAKTEDNLYKLEACFFKENIYDFPLKKLHEIYFNDCLKNESDSVIKNLHKIINRKGEARGYDEIYKENRQAIIDLMGKAKEKYYQVAQQRDPHHKYFFQTFKELNLLLRHCERDIGAESLESRTAFDQTVLLEDFEFDKYDFMHAAENKFFKLFKTAPIDIKLKNATNGRVVEQFSLHELDFDFSYRYYSDADFYNDEILQPAIEDLKNEIKNNNIFDSYSYYTKYRNHLREQLNEAKATFNSVQINYSGTQIQYQSKPEIDLTGDFLLLKDHYPITARFLHAFFIHEINALQIINTYLDKDMEHFQRVNPYKSTPTISGARSKFGDFPTQHQKEHGYNILDLLTGPFRKLENVNDKLSYLINARTDYLDFSPLNHEPDMWGQSFLDHINIWIKTYKKLISEQSNESAVMNPRINKSRKIENSKEDDPIEWNDNITLLVDVLIQLQKEQKNKNNEPIMTASNSRLAKLICDNFIDEDKAALKYDQILTRFSPSKESKRPKFDARVKVFESLSASRKKIAKEEE